MKLRMPEMPSATLLAALDGYNLLPAIVFLPTRRRCDQAASEAALSRRDPNDSRREARRDFMRAFVEQHPEVRGHRHWDTIIRGGVASHHAGHIPAWKLVIEKLMSAGLLDAIFATATVAAGVDFPARTVVLSLQRRRGARACDRGDEAGRRADGGRNDERRPHAPRAGYLAAVRELTRRNGVVLIFDEVKTGLTIAAGGAVERLGGDPDVVTLAKSLAGGLPAGAVGMGAEFEYPVARGDVRLMGTYNGNPLSMAAANASLRQVLTPAAYDELERLGARMADGVQRAIEAAGLHRERGRPRLQGLRQMDGRPRAVPAGLDVADEPRPPHHRRPWTGVEPDRGPRRADGRPLRGRLRRPARRAHSTIVRLCSRMNCGRYQAPSPPLPVEPLDFQPPKVCEPGQAPVVAPAPRLT